MTENIQRNYLKGILKKKWYSWVFLAAIIFFFLSISCLFVQSLYREGIIDLSEVDWTPEQWDRLFKWIGEPIYYDVWSSGLLDMFSKYGNRLGLLCMGVALFFGGLLDYTLPKEVRRSLIIAVGIALAGYLVAYLFFMSGISFIYMLYY